ncbi:flagellar biosynthetic protein FliO [Microbacterium sp. 1S1]|uniref:flagellar biosynthetic protein FliO n=1 Tax=Microbacterium sp. 1S1 TaxID=2606451 RepID=UPI0021CCDCC4|nr:flagellar biosynthetic protein FliO [Microbacterium sp. 1S1]
MTVLGRQGIGPKAQLVVVQTDDARYVLGVTEHGVSVVDRLPLRPAPVDGEGTGSTAEPSSDDAEFDRILAAAALTSPPAASPPRSCAVACGTATIRSAAPSSPPTPGDRPPRSCGARDDRDPCRRPRSRLPAARPRRGRDPPRRAPGRPHRHRRARRGRPG